MAWHEGSATSGGELSPKVVEWMTANQLLLAARYARGEMWERVAVVQIGIMRVLVDERQMAVAVAVRLA